MLGNPFVFDSIIFNGYDYLPDGIGHHLRLLDHNLFQVIPAERKSLSAIQYSPENTAYGKVTTDLHLKYPNRFKNCLYLDVARETWDPDRIRRQITKTVHHKRVFNAVTAVYLMWESDQLWDLYADMISSYDFCIVTSSILDESLTGRGIDFVKLKHPYDFEVLDREIEVRQKHSPLRFGISAGLWSRKNLSLLAKQFVEAFGDDPRVLLSIHTRSDINQADFKTEFGKIRQLQSDCHQIELVNKTLSRSDYLRWLKSIDIYCFVSSGEGYSVTPREALHLGIPVILHDAHIHREFAHLPGVVPVPSRGIQVAKANTSMYSYDIGRDWCIDETALRHALIYSRENCPKLKHQLTKNYKEILAYHDIAKIKQSWIAALNEKYEVYIDRVHVKYPRVSEALLESFPGLENLDSNSLVFQSNTGCFLGDRVYCLKSEHVPGHCLFGPSVRVTEYSLITVSFKIDVLSDELPDSVANIEIYDNDSEQILCITHVTQEMISGIPNTFTLETRVSPGQVLEFRVYWFGTTDLCVNRPTVDNSN